MPDPRLCARKGSGGGLDFGFQPASGGGRRRTPGQGRTEGGPMGPPSLFFLFQVRTGRGVFQTVDASTALAISMNAMAASLSG